MQRVNFHLTDDQLAWLRGRQESTGVPVAEQIRRAIDRERTMTTTLGWIQWTAHNSETQYGWTEDESVVQAVTDWLNRGKEINLYAASPVDLAEFGANLWAQSGRGGRKPPKAELEALADARLQEWSGLLCGAESTPDNFDGEND